MNDGTPLSALQSLPSGTALPHRAAPDDLGHLLAIAQECGKDADALDIARAVVALIVGRCSDVVAACVYRLDATGDRLALQARAGDRTAFAESVIPLAEPGSWPRRAAAASPADIVVPLRSRPEAPSFGWLWIAIQGAPSPSRIAFAACAAQALAQALSRASERDTQRARSEALARREEAVAIFLADVSNEIRTPLTLVLGPLEAAVNRNGDSGLKVSLRHAQRLKRLVDALLDLSLIDAGRGDPILQPIDVAALTCDVASSFHGASIAAGVTLVVDCPKLPQAIQLDRRQWEQIVIHLLGNAIKFAPAGVVTVSLRSFPGLMTLEVTDTGQGIDPDDLPHLFERFYRARGRDESNLGLALVRELVRLHGGDVDASSTPGRGTRVRISIPMLGNPVRAVPHRRVDETAVQRIRARPVNPLEWTAAPTSRALAEPLLHESDRRERIVVAIDHPELRDYVTGLLQSHYHVQSLGSPQDALRAVADHHPDLALVDLGNPAIDGLTFLRELRATSGGAVLPALLLSWDTRAAAHADAVEAGAADLIGKPFAAAGPAPAAGPPQCRTGGPGRAPNRGAGSQRSAIQGHFQSRTGHPVAHRCARPHGMAQRPVDAVHG